MGTAENLVKLRGILSTFANLIREGEGTDAPISVADMRQKMAAIDLATFDINNGVLSGYTLKEGAADESTPEDTQDYFRKLLSNFADKVRIESEQLNIDNINTQKDLVCGAYKNTDKENRIKLRIPDIVTEIRQFATDAAARNRILEIELPSSVVTINNNAFSKFANMETINIPNSVTSIGNYAFYRCGQLSSIQLPAAVSTIGTYAFSDCNRLTQVQFLCQPTAISDGMFARCSALTSVIIPNSVTSIKQSAFNNCTSLTSIIIPNSVTSIWDGAFAGSGLTSIEIPASITTLTSRAFAGCSNLETVTLPNTLTTIGSGAFYACSKLGAITLPASLTTIDSQAFDSCSKLLTIEIPDSVSFIGDYCFTRCSKLESVTLPTNNNFTTISGGMFQYCSRLSTITIPDSVEIIDNEAFAGTALSNITLPDSVTTIRTLAFDCSHLESIYIPASVTEIGTRLFGSYCNQNLVITIDANNQYYSVDTNSTCILSADGETLCVGTSNMSTIPGSVRYINSEACADINFYNQVSFPENLLTIGEAAFQNASNIAYDNLTIPRDVYNIGYNAFGGTSIYYFYLTYPYWISDKKTLTDDSSFISNIIYGIETSNYGAYLYVSDPNGESSWSGYVSELTVGSGSGDGDDHYIETSLYAGPSDPVSYDDYLDSGSKYYDLTVAEDGDYYIYLDSEEDSYGVLYDNSWNELNNDDSSGSDGSDFCISCYLYAGYTYYIEVKQYNEEYLGSYTLHIDTTGPESN